MSPYTSSAFDRYTEFNGLDQLVLAVSGNLMAPTAELQLNYTPGGDRYLRRERTSAGLTTTRVYGNVEEVRKPNGTVETRRTLDGVVIETKQGAAFNSGTPELRYLFTDHLGSLDVIANVSGVAVERLSFDAHGRRRQVSDWRSTVLPSVPVTTPRGFTGHEHLDAFALIHMNGRVYDPELGRFLQPDPVLDAGIQGMNRYSYVLNNPLSLTDPSGHLSVGEIIRIAAAVVITVYTGGAAISAWGAGAYGSALTIAAMGGAFAGVLTTGTTKGGVQGAFGAMAFLGVSGYFQNAQWAKHATEAGKLSTIGRAAKIVAHGVTGGILADVQGGKFAHGFASAGFSEAAGPLTQGIGSDLVRGVAQALIGGTSSKLSGGKFSNGAVTGAMAFAFGRAARQINSVSDSALDVRSRGPRWTASGVKKGFEGGEAGRGFLKAFSEDPAQIVRFDRATDTYPDGEIKDLTGGLQGSYSTISKEIHLYSRMSNKDAALTRRSQESSATR